jgi:predicted ester cyclase
MPRPVGERAWNPPVPQPVEGAMSENDAAPLPKSVIEAFFRDVRSGKHLEAVSDYMADAVTAHQVCSEDPMSIVRSATGYADHVREMVGACANFRVTIDELIVEGDRAFVRWTQHGTYPIADEDGDVAPTDIAEFASAVYRVAGGKIVEYWIQVDRMGTQRQVERAGNQQHVHGA